MNTISAHKYLPKKEIFTAKTNLPKKEIFTAKTNLLKKEIFTAKTHLPKKASVAARQAQRGVGGRCPCQRWGHCPPATTARG